MRFSFSNAIAAGLIVAATLLAVPAFASIYTGDWGQSQVLPLDFGTALVDVRRAEDTTFQYFRVVADPPPASAGAGVYSYGIYFNSQPFSLVDATFGVSYEDDYKIKKQNGSLTGVWAPVSFVNSDTAVSSDNFSVDKGTNTLEWRILKTDLPSAPFWWQAAVIKNQVEIIAQTKAAATPIPGAAWLLGSGLLGFIGIKRRNRSTY